MSPEATRITVEVFGRTDVGRQREHNEDSFLVADLSSEQRSLKPEVRHHSVGEAGSLFVVCDGMGGAAAGEVASQMAIDSVFTEMCVSPKAATQVDFATRLSAAMIKANARILEVSRQDATRSGLGTTCSAAGILAGRLVAAQVGDSRVYVIRAGQIVQVTRDQSLLNQLLDSGQIQEADVPNFEHTNVILQALGVMENVQPVFTEVPLMDGDRVLVCSDGLNGVVADATILATVQQFPDPVSACKRLTELANEAGGPDNITVILANLTGPGLMPANPAMAVEVRPMVVPLPDQGGPDGGGQGPTVTQQPDSPSPQTGGAAPQTGGAAPQTGGAAPQTGGAAPQTGGATPQTGGVAPQTGGAAPQTGGPPPQTGGAAPQAGGPPPQTGGAAPQTDANPPPEAESTPAQAGKPPAVATTVVAQPEPAAAKITPANAPAGKVADGESVVEFDKEDSEEVPWEARKKTGKVVKLTAEHKAAARETDGGERLYSVLSMVVIVVVIVAALAGGVYFSQRGKGKKARKDTTESAGKMEPGTIDGSAGQPGTSMAMESASGDDGGTPGRAQPFRKGTPSSTSVPAGKSAGASKKAADGGTPRISARAPRPDGGRVKVRADAGARQAKATARVPGRVGPGARKPAVNDKAGKTVAPRAVPSRGMAPRDGRRPPGTRKPGAGSTRKPLGTNEK
jgi:serine/threonine protein phosphatase PrpC